MTKFLFGLVVSFSMAQQALACAPAEAQFIGQVTAVRLSGSQCQIQVGQFSHYQESGMCGLSSMSVQDIWLDVSSCNLMVGSPVSGYLSEDASGKIKLN